jgi:hypothetical protein
MQKQKDRSVLQASSKDKERDKEQVYDERNHKKHQRARDVERGSHDRGRKSVVCFLGFNM